MRRTGGVFVGIFMATGAVQAITGFVPELPSAAAPTESVSKQSPAEPKFTGNAGPIRSGSLPKKRWEELINKWGNLCPALTPALLAGQLHQESIGFKPAVVEGRQHSPAGAKGMAQFMDATWASHGIDGNGDGKRDKFDPEDAIPSAANYDCKVSGYVKNVPGDRSTNMLAAYNAGPYAVKRYGGVPPYNETQNYVRIIKRKAGGYEQ